MQNLVQYRRNRNTPVIVALCLCMLLLVSCNQVSSAATHTIATPLSTPLSHYQTIERSNVSYGPLAGEKLDLCQPQGATSPRPGVILIHGGGWTGGDKKGLAATCLYLAQHGFVVANIDYRLAQKAMPATRWPAQLVDSQLAVRWLRSQATQLDLAPQRLCSFGESAGGQLAVFLGELKSIHPGDQAHLLSTQSPSVSCVVDVYGPVDLTANKEQVLSSNLQLLFGGATYQNNPAIYKDASPLFFVNKNSAPTLIVQGSKDKTVPPAQSLALQQALLHDDVSTFYITYTGGHSYQGLNKQQYAHILRQQLSYLESQEKP